jgi:hypothetical protein
MALHVPHPHPHHPWRMLPLALGVIFVLAVLLIVVSFALSKWFTGSAY